MRIVIEIDGLELISKTEQSEGAAAVVPEYSVSATRPAVLTPPIELLKAAAALDAENAGPAPADVVPTSMTGVPVSAMHGFAGALESGAMDAGGAPDIAEEKPVETKEKEHIK